MRTRAKLYATVAAVALAGVLAGAPMHLSAQIAVLQLPKVEIDNDDIGGVVLGLTGPEAGVWVIAETTDLPTKFARMVVTDDAGRYVIPDLPTANYQVWVRGYGLVDSPKVRAKPGQTLNLTAVRAPSEAAAAHYYPAIYWYTLMKMPPASDFGGSTNIPKNITPEIWRQRMNNVDCVGCHQLGQESTRTIPAQFGEFKSHEEAWMRRIASGQTGAFMTNRIAGQMGGVPFKYFGDWTERVAKGEVPSQKPQRPQGVERNIVITLRDWMNEKQYLHDLIASDRRYPTVNAYGPLFGSPEYSSSNIPILDPIKNTATIFPAPVRDENAPIALGPGHAAGAHALLPSAYWGEEDIWDTRINNHNSMIGKDGRVWMAATFRAPNNPAYCKAGSDHPSAKIFPMNASNRHITVFDPKTKDYKFVDTCFGTHHLQFGYDANDTLWASGGGPVVGWLNTKMFDETGDAAKSSGWTPLILDTNGNGKRDAGWVEPNQAVDPTKDKRIVAGFYAVMPNPADGSIWGSVIGNPGAIVRLEPGPNPPATALAEIYNVPLPGFAARGADIDRNGVVWVSLGSGHLGSFDRSKCKGPLNGPMATGDHCPEGWTFARLPGPGFKGLEEFSVESSYYTWVDQFDTSGLGANTPIATGNLFDGVHALVGDDFVTLRIPYPLGFYSKGFDGRIDDADAGWKGRGLWVSSGDRTPWLMEGGMGSKPLVVHFQVRPDPLAK
jgi:hypothetical protein